MTPAEIVAIPAARIQVRPVLSVEQTEALLGTHLTDEMQVTILRENTDVYDEWTGKCVLKFRRNVIPRETVESAHAALNEAAVTSTNRGIAAGLVDPDRLDEIARMVGCKQVVLDGENSTRFRRVKADGSISATSYAIPVMSGVVGFMGGNPRFPYCRQTAYTQQNWEKFVKAYPIIKLVDTFYEALMPAEYAAQRAQANRTSPDFVIRDTAFTTVTVNKNWQTACHTDAGDFQGGFGNLVALRKGRFTGGYFVFPRYGVGVDMQNCDLLLGDVHQVHGNTPIHLVDRRATRISLVMYYREDIGSCGTTAQELQKARETFDKRLGMGGEA